MHALSLPMSVVDRACISSDRPHRLRAYHNRCCGMNQTIYSLMATSTPESGILFGTGYCIYRDMHQSYLQLLPQHTLPLAMTQEPIQFPVVLSNREWGCHQEQRH